MITATRPRPRMIPKRRRASRRIGEAVIHRRWGTEVVALYVAVKRHRNVCCQCRRELAPGERFTRWGTERLCWQCRPWQEERA